MPPWVVRYLPLVFVAANAYYVGLSNQHFRRGFFLSALIVALWLILLWFQDRRAAASAPLTPAPSSRPASSPRCSFWWSLAAFIVVMLVGVLGRAPWLAIFPALDHSVVEEVQTGGVALNSLTYETLDRDFPLTDLLAQIGLVSFGRTMGDLRLPFVIWSCLGVAVCHFATRRFFRHPLTAFLVTLLFATSTYAIAAGRTAMETFAPITTVLLALLALFHARRVGTRFAFALAGACTGLLFVEYFAFRFMGLVLTAWLLLLLAQGPSIGPLLDDSRPPRWRNLWQARASVGFFLLLLATVALPCWIELSRENWLNLLEGMKRNFVEDVAPALATQPTSEVAHAIGHKVVDQIFTLWFFAAHFELIGRNSGVLDPATGLVCVLAFGYALFTARRNPARWLPIVATLLAIFLAAALTPYVARYRVFCTLPFCLLMLGVPFDDLLLRPSSPLRRIVAANVVALALGLAAWNFWLFFESTTRDPDVRASHHDFSLLVAQELHRQQNTAHDKPLYLLSAPYVAGAVGGDAAFLLPPNHQIRFVDSLDAIEGPARVLATNDFVAPLRATPGFRILSRWQYQPIHPEHYVVAERD